LYNGDVLVMSLLIRERLPDAFVEGGRISAAELSDAVITPPHPLLWQPFLSVAEAGRCVCTENSSIGFDCRRNTRQHRAHDRQRRINRSTV